MAKIATKFSLSKYSQLCIRYIAHFFWRVEVRVSRKTVGGAKNRGKKIRSCIAVNAMQLLYYVSGLYNPSDGHT